MLGTASLQVILGYLQAHWRPLSALTAVMAVVGGVIVWYFLPEAETYGVISVDSPQVYTRERLVNDRFTEEAWLRQQLDWTQQLLESKRFDAPEAKISRTFDAFADFLMSIKGSGVAEDSKEDRGTSDVQWPATLQAFQELERASAIEQDPTDTFERARNYRDTIRADLLQTQLDDRHDIGGNTLYRLTFDASIVPGRNTRRAAEIVVTLAPLRHVDLRNEDSIQGVEQAATSERATSTNDSLKIVDAADESLYYDWQKHLQLTVTNAIDAQADEFIMTGTLSGIDGVALQEFIAKKLKETYEKILRPNTSNKDEDESVHEASPDAAKKNVSEDQKPLGDLVGNFKNSYIEKLHEDEAERFAEGVLQVVRRPGGDLPQGQLPMELCRLIQSRQESTYLCPDGGLLSDERDVLSSAVQFAQEQCSESKSGSFQVNTKEFPCPRTVSIEGTNFAELVLLRQMRFVLDFRLSTSGEQLHKPLCELLYPSPLGCNSNGAVQDGAPTRELFKLEKTFVRRVLVEYVRAKLNDESAVVRVKHRAQVFFDVDEEGCSYGLCNLVFRPNVSKIKSFIETLEEEVGMIFTYALDPSSEATSEDVEETDQALLRAEAGGRAQGVGMGGEGRFGGGMRASQALEMRHQAVHVVGFERPPPEHAKAEFGWVIHAGLGSGEGNPFDRKRQEPVHHQLSAVVSIPSWWRALSVTVRTAWLEEGEDPRTAAVPDTAARSCKNDPPVRTCSAFEVLLPGSVAEVSELFRYEVRTEPYIDARSLEALGPQSLEVGRKGLIVLEGGRLWRGTIVTVGHLKADKITVLPDMKGVIAEFKCVEPPPGLGYDFPVGDVPSPNVVVWTSEGRTATAYNIHLRPFKSRGKEDPPCKGPEQ